MYNLVLVDDDKALLDSLYMFIDWNKYDFEVVARLCNGLEVLEYIRNNDVDVVMTDIRMPGMDGIELASRLCEDYPDIKIVLISAFRDFQYAKQAIKYKVEDYINKPISHQEVEGVLKRIYCNLEKRSSEASGNNTGYRLIEEREKIFTKLLSSVVLDVEFYEDELIYAQIPYRPDCTKCVFATFEMMGIERQLKEEWKQDKKQMYETITNMVCVDTDEHFTVRLNFSENILSVLYVSRDNATITDKHTKKVIADLWKRYRIITVNETFINFASVEEFKNEVISAKTEEMKYLNNKIVVHSEEQILYEVGKYVNKHYQENITIGMFAKEYHFSEQYFGRLFKKITGKNFFDYLNEVRIEKAKILLQSGEKVEAVGKKVGFGNRMTFVRQFQYYTGEAPMQYRKNQMERK